MNKNDLASRMKSYEACYDIRTPKRTYTIIRLDGVGFSKYTKMFEKPFDGKLSMVMDTATIRLCEYLNPKFAYTQSDEISLVFTDIENIESELIFDGKVQKLCSISASKVTAAFNSTMLRVLSTVITQEQLLDKIRSGIFPEIDAVFDARVFIIPDFREVSNYFIWRQQDCTRNSVSMAAHALLGHNATLNKSGSEKQEMMFKEKGVNWNDYLPKYKRGVVIKKHEIQVPNPLGGDPVVRNKWLPAVTPIFTEEKEFLYNLIPTIEK
jgi:tRNA(His) 5'-end guanylyltransferase